MIVFQQHMGGHITPIHYPRQSIGTYVSRQAKSAFTLDRIDEFNVCFDMNFEFEIPFRTRVPKEFKKKYECIVNKEERKTLMIIPSVTIRFLYEEDVYKTLAEDPHAVVWKDLISLRGKSEFLMLNLIERVSLKVKPKKRRKKNPRRRYKK